MTLKNEPPAMERVHGDIRRWKSPELWKRGQTCSAIFSSSSAAALRGAVTRAGRLSALRGGLRSSRGRAQELQGAGSGAPVGGSGAPEGGSGAPGGGLRSSRGRAQELQGAGQELQGAGLCQTCVSGVVLVPEEEQRSRGAEEEERRGAEEQRSRGGEEEEEQRSRGAEEEERRGAEEEQRRRRGEEQRRSRGGGEEQRRGAEEEERRGAEEEQRRRRGEEQRRSRGGGEEQRRGAEEEQRRRERSRGGAEEQTHGDMHRALGRSGLVGLAVGATAGLGLLALIIYRGMRRRCPALSAPAEEEVTGERRLMDGLEAQEMEAQQQALAAVEAVVQGLSPDQQVALRQQLDQVLCCVTSLRSEVAELRGGLQDIALQIIQDVKKGVEDSQRSRRRRPHVPRERLDSTTSSSVYFTASQEGGGVTSTYETSEGGEGGVTSTYESSEGVSPARGVRPARGGESSTYETSEGGRDQHLRDQRGGVSPARGGVTSTYETSEGG
uniref:Uncharacterized protein n=1 Tax=Knipowitschia caucasica TaxID=637954 RepID=A0AAV2KCG8_KNICA